METVLRLTCRSFPLPTLPNQFVGRSDVCRGLAEASVAETGDVLHVERYRRPEARHGLRKRGANRTECWSQPDNDVHDPRQRLHASVRLLFGSEGKTETIELDEPERVAVAAESDSGCVTS